MFLTHTEVMIGSNVTLNGFLLTLRQIICSDVRLSVVFPNSRSSEEVATDVLLGHIIGTRRSTSLESLD